MHSDLLQETALRAWKAQAQFTLRTDFRAGIYRILRNEFISICRRAKRAPLPVDDVAGSLFGYEGDRGKGLESPIDRSPGWDQV